MTTINNQNQEDFLNKIATKLGRPRASGVNPPKWDHFPWDHLYQNATQEALIHEFTSNFEQIGGHLKRVKTQDVPQVVKQLIQQYEASKVLAWQDERLTEFGLEQAFLGTESLFWEIEQGFESLTNYAKEAQIGITYTDLGLAETGTIVLFNEAGKGRSVSLLPETHIAILPASQIKARLTQALQRIKKTYDEHGKLPSLINFITGPSRTSDIEMVLTIGVHGPKELHVIVVDDR